MMRIPMATYRIQFNPSFTFGDAMEIVPYLADLGLSDIYASPIFRARKGSTHGYDVVDPNQLNPDLGGEEGFEALVKMAQKHGIGWLQDIIPNHMAFDYENGMLMDVLENGPDSKYFRFFDMEWDHPYETIRGRLLAPFLGRFGGECLEDGEIQITYGEAGLTLVYYDLRFPLKIESYLTVFTHRLETLRRQLGSDHPDFVKLLGVLYGLKTLPTGEQPDERYDQIRFIKRVLWELYTKNHEIRGFIDENISIFNGEKGNPDSFNLLDALLAEQFFRLSFWKVATEEINYRRFFNINELICLRVEDEDVFSQTHSLTFKLVGEQKITGLRIDHIDGLYDPAHYLKRIREKAGNLYVVVEKILDSGEELSSLWPIQGTTGYEFLNYVTGILCKTSNKRALDRIYTRFTGLQSSYEDLVADKKRLIMGRHMAGDVDNLALLLKRISGRYRHGADITLYGLKRALVEIMALFPVYRTYISNEVFSDADREYMKDAIGKALESNPALANELGFLQGFLLLKFEDYLTEEERAQWARFVMRFQQFTGPLMAKGFEDTALYAYNRLLSLNEVGGDPHRCGFSLIEFHAFNERRARLWPHTLNATSTHDTKRGEDVRARINVLSEIPQEWARTVNAWHKLNRSKKKKVRGFAVPDKNDEYFLYQTLIGALPLDEKEYPTFTERLNQYAVKAVREAKAHTAWLKPDNDYEEAFLLFIEHILGPSEENQFLASFLPFQRKVAFYGMLNSLSQTIIKLTAPGVPDFYRGTELWDLNLVDPDNRRPVDFGMRISFLREIQAKACTRALELITELRATEDDGRIKLFLICMALKARKEHADLFEKGAYAPLKVSGGLRDHLIAFSRNHGTLWALTIAPRFLTALVKEGEYPLGHQVWADTSIHLPEGAPSLWEDAITQQGVKGQGALLAGQVMRHFPVAMLTGKEDT
jgi:(1->4)-alpha-D-glucan 1-alpha-D-glucosylmutase